MRYQDWQNSLDTYISALNAYISDYTKSHKVLRSSNKESKIQHNNMHLSYHNIISDMKQSTKYNARFILISLLALSLPVIQGSPYILSDDRVRSLDAIPALGRGYSIMTNSFQSTCLKIDATTVPSFNYDCKYLDSVMQHKNKWFRFISYLF